MAPEDLFTIADAASPDDRAAGLHVAAVVADVLRSWPTLTGQIAAGLKAEGLIDAAAVVQAHQPELMKVAIEAAAGVPASEVLQARALVKAMRITFGTGYSDAARALSDTLRDCGTDDLAEALIDLADAVETVTAPTTAQSPVTAETARAIDREVQVRALRSARNVGDLGERRRALNSFARSYGEPSADLLAEAVYGPMNVPAAGKPGSSPGRRVTSPTTKRGSR